MGLYGLRLSCFKQSSWFLPVFGLIHVAHAVLRGSLVVPWWIGASGLRPTKSESGCSDPPRHHKRPSQNGVCNMDQPKDGQKPTALLEAGQSKSVQTHERRGCLPRWETSLV